MKHFEGSENFINKSIELKKLLKKSHGKVFFIY